MYRTCKATPTLDKAALRLGDSDDKSKTSAIAMRRRPRDIDGLIACDAMLQVLIAVPAYDSPVTE